MDLYDKNEVPLANMFLDQYLMVTGDYDGLAMLPFYLVYRAVVRAKINLITSSPGTDTQHHTHSVTGDYQSYINLALDCTHRQPAVLYITHGLAGSGKSTLAKTISHQLGVVRIRSDVERKRLFCLPAIQRTGSGPESGIYTADVTRNTYEKLCMLGESVLKAGYSVIIDAGFLQQWQRCMFQQLARKLSVQFTILDLQVPIEELRRRVTDRWEKQKDPSEATIEILELQLNKHQPLTSAERCHRIVVESSSENLLEMIHKINAGRRRQLFSEHHSQLNHKRS